jgi:hypothetical protein
VVKNVSNHNNASPNSEYSPKKLFTFLAQNIFCLKPRPILTLNQIFHKKKCLLSGWHFSARQAGWRGWVGRLSFSPFTFLSAADSGRKLFTNFLPRRPAASFQAKNDNLKWSVPGGTIIYLPPRFFSAIHSWWAHKSWPRSHPLHLFLRVCTSSTLC